MKEKRKSFVVYRSYVDAIRTMEPKDQVKMWNAIADFALDGKEPELTGALNGFWLLIRPGIDSNIKKYEGGYKGKQYGKKGGRPPTPPIDDNADVNVNVNDNDNDNGKNNPMQTPTKPHKSELFDYEVVSSDDEFFQSVFNATVTLMKRKISIVKFKGLTDQFISEQRLKQPPPRNIDDYKNHFVNWMKIQTSKQENWDRKMVY